LERLRNLLPPRLKEKLNARQIFSIADETEKQWFQELGIYEFVHFILNRKKEEFEKPEYFKWFEDCLWMLGYKDTMCIVNIFLFNKEPLEDISNIIMFRFRKKVAQEALKKYQEIFWDTEAVNAKEALYFCRPFQDNTLIVKDIKQAGITIEQFDSSDDGIDIVSIFHESNYIKWKLGVKEFEAPKPQDFLKKVMNDSYFKYYESMNMIRSVEEESETGSNDKLGPFDSKKIRRRNVEEQKAKLAKHWLEVYLKANKYKKSEIDGDGDKGIDVFEKMRQVDMRFDEESLINIDDNPEIFDDIKEDL